MDAPAYTLRQIQELPKQRAVELDYGIEAMMDIQIIAGLCANAEIDVYFSSFDQRGWVDPERRPRQAAVRRLHQLGHAGGSSVAVEERAIGDQRAA